MVFYYEIKSKLINQYDGSIYEGEKIADIYIGKDKNENEVLLKYALPYDVWFKVDITNSKSAHVYLRTVEEVKSYRDLPVQAVNECAQLALSFSSTGCPKEGVKVSFTWVSNLKKTSDMEVGAVSFKNEALLNSLHLAKIRGDVIQKLNLTKSE